MVDAKYNKLFCYKKSYFQHRCVYSRIFNQQINFNKFSVEAYFGLKIKHKF